MKAIFNAAALLICVCAFAGDDLRDWLPGNTVIEHRHFLAAFDAARGIPRFVVYRIRLGQAHLADRKAMSFHADPDAPASALPSIYDGSGYDRGHMCPAEDMAFDVEAMRETFVTSNCCPRLPALNRGDWKELETQLRKEGQSAWLIIVCGPIFYGPAQRVLGLRVAVPDAFFKVAYSARGPPRAWLFPNVDGPNLRSESYIVDIKRVAELTGLEFKEQEEGK